MKILVTGCAGFIGMHVCTQLWRDGHNVVGLDSMNEYYNLNLKIDRLARLKRYNERFEFIQGNLAYDLLYDTSLKCRKFDVVIHLAAQPGVRYSFENPESYIQNNYVATYKLFNWAKDNCERVVYASSSSVYGDCNVLPYSESMTCNMPRSLYAATKQGIESLAYFYANAFKMTIVGLRYFTVYGPWGRPDMAPWIFTKNIIEGKPIKVFNKGAMSRDFTYISDITNATCKVAEKIITTTSSHQVFNVCREQREELLTFIEIIEKQLGKKALVQLEPMQPGDVVTTYGSNTKLKRYIDTMPIIDLDVGLREFVKWYKSYHGVK